MKVKNKINEQEAIPKLLQEAKELNAACENSMKRKQDLEKAIKPNIIIIKCIKKPMKNTEQTLALDSPWESIVVDDDMMIDKKTGGT